MALYLGEHKVSLARHEVSYIQVPSGEEIPELIDSSNSVTVTKSQWQDMEDAVKRRTGTYDTNNFSIDDMIDEITSPYDVNMNVDYKMVASNSNWSRPSGWPNLDSLNLTFEGTDDFIYMTYRTGHTDDFFACYITTVSGTATIDFGHINNNTYVIDSTRTAGSTSGANFYAVFNSDTGYNTTGYTIIRVTGKIKYFYLIDATYSNFNISGAEARTFKVQQQHLLERIAYVPNIINFYTSGKFWGTYDLQREKIGNGAGTACTSVQAMYYYCFNLKELDVSNFFTPNITNMQETFRQCYNLKTLDLSNWNVSKVTTLYLTFYWDAALQELNLSNWDTIKLTSLAQTFQECRSLKTLQGLENFNTTLVTNMNNLFNGCRSLEGLDNIVDKWNVGNVTNLSATFASCYKIKNLDLSTWNVGKVTRVDSLFANCHSLKNIKFPQVQTANLQYISSLFSNCYALQNVNVNWLKMNGGTCLQMSNLFYNCRNLLEINIPSNWNLSALNNSNYSHYQIFCGCNSVKKITGITNWDFRSSTGQSAQGMFNGCYCLKELDISGWKMNSNNYSSFFYGCWSLESVNISGLDAVNCTTLASMFCNCFNLKQITFPSSWNTAKVTTLSSMFYGCWSLQEINLNFSALNLEKVTTLVDMFAYCYSLKSINLNNLNLPACTTIATMFNYDYGLEELSWSGWQIPKVTSTSPGRILGSCWNLRKITGFPPIKLAFSMTENFSLPVEEIVTLFNNLETCTTARAITLNNTNINRLSATEKAIATGKNWTLAN